MRYNANWASHLPTLIKVMNNSDGPVLELGMGPFSTPILHELCFDAGRKLFSYENVPGYYKLSLPFETYWHKIMYVKNWDDSEITGMHWGVVFIDHEPAERRKIDIKRVADIADFIIVHDSETKNDHKYGFNEVYPMFKYRFEYMKQTPQTAVLSNFKNLIFLST